MPTVHFPGPTERALIIGRTGSGKTVLASYILSLQDIEARPWIIFNAKRDPLFEELAERKAIRGELGVNSKPPKSPGLYVVHYLPAGQDKQIEALLWRIWEKGNIGIWVDEMYSFPQGDAFAAILTQGRTKRLPVIALAQRPTHISRFAVSETSYFACFRIIDDRDWKTIRGFCPVPDPFRPAEYSCFWYDVKRDQKFMLQPVRHESIGAIIAQKAPRPFFGW